jgi:hypothetical protein
MIVSMPKMVPNGRERMVQVLTRRDLLSAGGALAAGILTRRSGFAQSASAGAASSDPMSYVNPEFRAALGPMAKMMEPVQSLNASSLMSLRQGMNMPANAPAPNPPVTEKTIPGPTGAPAVRVYVVGNSPGASKPAVLHMHGGGYGDRRSSGVPENIRPTVGAESVAGFGKAERRPNASVGLE